MIVREMESRDIQAVLAIQSAAPEAAQWKAVDYEERAHSGVTRLVAERDRQIAGFLIARQVADEFEILNVAVAPAFRRQGIAKVLLCQALTSATAAGASSAYLEVRSSNKAAVTFYEESGFRVSSRRPLYYAAPIEDALVLALQLKKI